jgi:hypothetical protein
MLGLNLNVARIADAMVSVCCLAMRLTPLETEMLRLAMASVVAGAAALFVNASRGEAIVARL